MKILSRRAIVKLLLAPIAASVARIGKSDGIEGDGSSPSISGNVNSQFYGGWAPDPPHFEIEPLPQFVPQLQPVPLPPSIDFRKKVSFYSEIPVYCQGQIQSCTANALAFLVDFNLRKNGKPLLNPSRLFIYYYARLSIGGTDATQFDVSVANIDAINALMDKGVCPEDDWLYDARPSDCKSHQFPSDHRATMLPSEKARDIASKYRSWKPGQLKTFQELKLSLAKLEPFLLGIDIYPSFFDDGCPPCGAPSRTRPVTCIPMPPSPGKKCMEHCVVAVGYIDEDDLGDKGYFICRNSWGEGVQEGGHFYLPYEYVKKKSNGWYKLEFTEATDFELF